MDQQQQIQHADNIIIEMLEFLDSSSEEGDDLDNNIKSQTSDELQTVKKDFNDNILPVKNEKNSNLQNYTKKAKSSLTKELQKLKQQFPAWNTKDIEVSLSDPLYYKTRSSILNVKNNASTEADNSTTDNNNLDWHLRLETNCRRNGINNSYIQEVQKAIYGDKTGHPVHGSIEYYQAAQTYLETLLNEKNRCGSESTNLRNNLNTGLYQLNQGLGVLGGTAGSDGNIGKPNTTSAGLTTPQTCAFSSASTSSSAAYYQLCNGINSHLRPAISSNTMNSATYGIFLGNKVTYVATTPTAPSLIYNQHSKTTTNFIANSLANAALATSPTILYTNPMLTTTTQQYLNTFFKETQFLGAAAAAGLTANSAQATALTSNGTSTGLYERLVYAQMLQQQLYYQTQQAAAVAAMLQHKQRAAAAAAAAAAVAASSTQQTNASANVSRTSPQHFNAITTTTNAVGPKANTSSSGSTSTTSSDFVKTKQQSPTVTNSSANVENVSVSDS